MEQKGKHNNRKQESMKYNEIYLVYMPYIEAEKFGLGSGLMLKTFRNEFHAYTFTKWMVVVAPN